MTPPTSHADDYLGVSLSQLIVALGLTLGGPPPQGLEELRPLRSRQTAAAPEPTARPASAPAAASTDEPPVPVTTEQMVKSPEMH